MCKVDKRYLRFYHSRIHWSIHQSKVVQYTCTFLPMEVQFLVWLGAKPHAGTEILSSVHRERESTQLFSSWSNITISASALLFWLMKGAILATVTSLQSCESDFQQLLRTTCANSRCNVREGSHIYTSFDAGQYCCKWFYFCFAHEFPNLDEGYSIFVVHVLFK